MFKKRTQQNLFLAIQINMKANLFLVPLYRTEHLHRTRHNNYKHFHIHKTPTLLDDRNGTDGYKAFFCKHRFPVTLF